MNYTKHQTRIFLRNFNLSLLRRSVIFAFLKVRIRLFNANLFLKNVCENTLSIRLFSFRAINILYNFFFE